MGTKNMVMIAATVAIESTTSRRANAQMLLNIFLILLISF
jgi:hypothetical protein